MEQNPQTNPVTEYINKLIEYFMQRFGHNLLPEQQRHVARLITIVYTTGAAIDVSQMGLGKTRSALAVAAAFGYDVFLIGPGNSEAVFRQDAMLYGTRIKGAYTYAKFAGQGQKNREGYRDDKNKLLPLDNGYLDGGLLYKTTKVSEKGVKQVSFDVRMSPDMAYNVFHKTLIIVDEVHKMKEASTNTSKSVRAFLNFAISYRDLNPNSVDLGILLLSGTPYDKVQFAETFIRAVGMLSAPKNYDVINNRLEYTRGPAGEIYGIGQVIARSRALEQLVSMGYLTSMNEKEKHLGIIDSLIETYIEGDSKASSFSSGKRSVLRDVVASGGGAKDTSRRSKIEQVIDNFMHEIVSKEILPIIGDAIQPQRVNKIKQKRITRFIPLRTLNFAGEPPTDYIDRIKAMDEKILKFAKLIASLPSNPKNIGEVGKTLGEIQNEMMFDVALSVHDTLQSINDSNGRTAKCIIFTTWINGVNIADQVLRSYGYPVLVLTGQVTRDKRPAILNAFMQHDSMYRVIIVTLGTGAEAISLDDRSVGGRFPRYSYVLPNYSITQLHQAASRQERITTTSEGVVYNIYPQTRNELFSIVNAIARKTVVLDFVSLTSEIEYPGTYDIVVDPVEDRYREFVSKAAYMDPDYPARVKSGIVAYEAFITRNGQSALTAEEVMASFDNNKSTVIEGVTAGSFGNDPTSNQDEDESSGTPKRGKRGAGAVERLPAPTTYSMPIIGALPVISSLATPGMPTAQLFPGISPPSMNVAPMMQQYNISPATRTPQTFPNPFAQQASISISQFPSQQASPFSTQPAPMIAQQPTLQSLPNPFAQQTTAFSQQASQFPSQSAPMIAQQPTLQSLPNPFAQQTTASIQLTPQTTVNVQQPITSFTPPLPALSSIFPQQTQQFAPQPTQFTAPQPLPTISSLFQTQQFAPQPLPTISSLFQPSQQFLPQQFAQQPTEGQILNTNPSPQASMPLPTPTSLQPSNSLVPPLSEVSSNTPSIPLVGSQPTPFTQAGFPTAHLPSGTISQSAQFPNFGIAPDEDEEEDQPLDSMEEDSDSDD